MLRIMDDLSNAKPLSGTYLSLWCRMFDECVVTISNPRELAFEAGFSGQRAESAWVSRMKILEELGFIDAKEGPAGKYSYVLVWSPYLVIKQHRGAGKVTERKYNALFARAQQVGARDLDDPAEEEEELSL